MILELLSSKYDHLVGYQELIQLDQVDEYIYKHYAPQEVEEEQDEENSDNQQRTFDTLVQHEDQMIQWKKDKRKVQLQKRRAKLLKLQDQIADNVNDYDKIGDHQFVDHAPDYETTQNEALSMECTVQIGSQKQNHNPLDENINEDNSLMMDANKIQSVNDHCNQYSLEKGDNKKKQQPQITTHQASESANGELQTPYGKSKDVMSSFTPGQISPPVNDANKSLKSGVHGKEYSLTDDKSFQVSDNDDRNFSVQNPAEPQMFLGLPQQKNNKLERQITSEEPNSVISEETSNKEQTPSGFQTRKNRKMKDIRNTQMNDFYLVEKSINGNEQIGKFQINDPKQKARRTGTSIKPPEKNSPFKKSPTQKYKTQQDSVSGATSSKFVVNLINKKYDGHQFTSRGSHQRNHENQLKMTMNQNKFERSRDEKHDLNSSLNLTMDNKMEDLSINFNQQNLVNEINEDESRKQRTHSYKSQSIKTKIQSSQFNKQSIIAQSRYNQLSPRQRIQRNARYQGNRINKQEKQSDIFHIEQVRPVNDQMSNFAKSDSIDRTLNLSPTISPFDRNNENLNQAQKLKSTSRYSTKNRNKVVNYQGNMKVVQKPILETNGSKLIKADASKKQTEKKQLYSNNLKIHTKYNKNLLKNPGFQMNNNASRRYQNNSLVNSVDTDRSSHLRKRSVKSSLENSQSRVADQKFKTSGSDLKIMQINTKETKFQADNSIISMSSSHRDENFSKNMSSIIQNSSGPYVGISQQNLMDSSLAANQKNDDLIQMSDVEYDRLMLLYKLVQSEKTSNVVQNQLKKRMFNELITQIERRLSILKSQHNHLLKQKMLCNIYGQKFQAIMYGGVSYKDHYFEQSDQHKMKMADNPMSYSHKNERVASQHHSDKYNGSHSNQTNTQVFLNQPKKDTKTDINMSKLKDYSDQNELLPKSSEYTQSKRKSQPFCQSKNSSHSRTKTNNNEEYDTSRQNSKEHTSGWATNKQTNDEVNYGPENTSMPNTQQRDEDTTDSFFEFKNSAQNIFNQTFNQTFNQSNQQNMGGNQQQFPISHELIQSHNFYIQFLALNEKLNYSPQYQNKIKSKILELEIVENEILKLIQLAQRNETQFSQPVQQINNVQIVNQQHFYHPHQRQKSSKFNYQKYNSTQDQVLVNSMPQRHRSKGSPVNFNESKLFKKKINNANNMTAQSKSMTQGQKFYQQKLKFLDPEQLMKPQNLKRTELSRITELHMAGENSQQNFNKLSQQLYHQRTHQDRRRNNSRRLIHQESTNSQFFDDQQGQVNKRFDVNLIDMAEPSFETNMASSAIQSSQNKHAMRNQVTNSAHYMSGSSTTNPQNKNATEQKINHYREKIKKYSNAGVNKISQAEIIHASSANDSQVDVIQDTQNRSKTSHMQTNKLPTIKVSQGSFIESGHKIISDKATPREGCSPRKQSVQRNSQLQYQYKNISSRQRLNQSINAQNSYMLSHANPQMFEYDLNASYNVPRTRTNQVRMSAQQNFIQSQMDQMRMLPNVQSSFNRRKNGKITNSKYSKVLSDYLNSKNEQFM